MEGHVSTIGWSSADVLRRLREGVDRSAEEVRESRMNGSADVSEGEAAGGRTHLLGLLLAGADPKRLSVPSASSIGYGSRVELEELDGGSVTMHHLMSSDAMDLEAGHVSIESPLGQALLGRAAGDVVEVETPRGTRTFRIRSVLTLPELLDEIEEGAATAIGGER